MIIHNFKAFIFDLDGTIIDSEMCHYEAYNLQLEDKISFETYCEIFHSSKKYDFIKLNKIDLRKKEQDFKEFYLKKAKLIDGFEDFFKIIIENSKTTAIVTNSSKERCEFIKSLHPILNNIDLWITKDDVKYVKPNPEGYIKAINQIVNNNKIKLEEIIIFEDSHIGLESIKDINSVTKIFMNTNNYITNNYKYLTLDNYSNINENKIIDEIIIVACGKGSRLYPYTIHIPKFLINLDNKNLLCKQIEYWSKYSKSFTIIIEDKFNEITRFYCDLYNDINYKIINVSIKNNEENSYTIQKGLGEDYNNRNLIITWCDILLTDELDLSKFNNNLIFTYGNECRYMATNNKLEKMNDGNVIGCYYINNYKQIIIDEPKQDLCDIFMDNFNTFNVYELEGIIDIGDLKKLNNYRNLNNSKLYKTRFFNDLIEINEGYLKKIAIDKKGLLLIKNEINFYKFISFTNIQELFPKIIEYSDSYFIMEKLNATPLYLIKDKYKYLPKIIEKIEKLHNYDIKKIDDIKFETDLKIEFCEKIIQRYENIKSIIHYLDIESINGVKINDNFYDIINDLWNDIYLFYKNKDKNYHIIHGDCNFSNILITNDDKIKLIDPRGYFGNSYIHGVKEYDYSKLIFALSGYDEFNNKDDYYFDYDPLRKNINLNIPIIDLNDFQNAFEDFDICLKMTIIHWLGLAEYNKNNIHKCIGSFYFGIYLYNLYIKIN